MPIGLPARIVCAEGLAAQAVTRHGACAIDLARTGSLPAGAWVLAFRGVARAVIDAERARDIDVALDALEAIASGELDGVHASLGLARYFAAVNRHGGANRSALERAREQ
ncbi:HypC/HybG/HupF family hydrogenase formation chaperone [Paraburkholderia sacchari]|uniref:HypC/HybG/HupF family hydrogenase formation chaperone n=1 Tax=Paraburkholderia sacchari TaxID=159450 RepID=UPI001BCF9FDA|nr:HypC/HybG/HupF family hydrogenase formation chaperone [Paraburkholderia sacchari]